MESKSNLNVPQSDLEWRYEGLLGDLYQAWKDLDKVIREIALIKEPDESTDILVAQKLDSIAGLLRNCVFTRDDELDEVLEDN